MENKSDAQLRRLLKNWVSRPSLPFHGRERLIIKAAAFNKINLNALPYHLQFKSYPLTYSNDWSQTLFTWLNVSPFQVEYRPQLGEYAY